ncbi:sodium/potassium-transporting ATPase subunit beta-1-interacting protein 1 [Exaiptasia diaphana]|uniref:Sodium/potassium-transporting ATPase subunit beta-1-interacting protein n=1 Tax=Exaiptasia diaphana TaxID=2652724 RepID=A0A913X4E6_EXADI|nr:sodium/potassium-transporting ATPase subunit beta-1-interacting protein 1 [Exaiptasia diaphana]KXJ15563.1 Sodium/potassium-transporting ATPase subunit beta-1-interacting protein 1 [Exaiptasia diaphana]
MGCCKSRNILFFVLVLQLLLVVERLVFDFLGFMWAPIICNFIHIAFVIVGIFGAHQYRSPYVITYSVWNLLWFGINLTIIALYLEIGMITHKDDWLSLKTNHKSWWANNGFGCGSSSSNSTSSSIMSPDGCIVKYEFVESIQCGTECILAFIGFWLGCWFVRTYHEDDDHFDYIGGFDSYSAYHPPTKSSRMQMQPIAS